jgi:hypothetical protein
MRAGSSNEVSIGKALLFDAFEKKSGSPARRVQHVGFADDGDKALGGKMQTLSVSESLPG